MNNLRFAFRQLRKAPAFTLTALATVAICLGANLAIFAVINSILLRPLPFPQSDRLVTILQHLSESRCRERRLVGHQLLRATRQHSRRSRAFPSSSTARRSRRRIPVRPSRKRSCACRLTFSRRLASSSPWVVPSPKRKHPTRKMTAVCYPHRRLLAPAPQFRSKHPRPRSPRERPPKKDHRRVAS